MDDSRSSYELARKDGRRARQRAPERRLERVLSYLSPMQHAACLYKLLKGGGGARRNPLAVAGERHPCDQFLHGTVVGRRRRSAAPFISRCCTPASTLLERGLPLRLDGRRLESFKTGLQTGGFSSPLHAAARHCSSPPEDGARYGLRDAPRAVHVARGVGRWPGRVSTRNLRPGLAFMNLHFPDLVG